MANSQTSVLKRNASSICLWAIPLLLYVAAVTFFIRDSGFFEYSHTWFLAFNALLVVAFFLFICFHVISLARAVVKKEPGALLTRRLVLAVVGVMLVPSLLLYAFSAWLILVGIDGWFHVDVELALKDSLSLQRHVLKSHLAELEVKSEHIPLVVAETPDELLSFTLQELMDKSRASEISVYSENLDLIQSISSDMSHPLFSTPPAEKMRDVEVGKPYIGVDTVTPEHYYVRLVFYLESVDLLAGGRFLQVLYPASEYTDFLVQNVEKAYKDYNRLAFLREELGYSSILTLTMVLLTSVLGAGWMAFLSARQITRPVLSWVRGTKAVALGKLDVQIEKVSDDELGQLVEAFNDMTRQLVKSEESEKASRWKIEQQHSFLEAVMQHIPSGVIVLDKNFKLQSANASSEKILKAKLSSMCGCEFEEVVGKFGILRQFAELIKQPSASAGSCKKTLSLKISRKTKKLACFSALLHFGETMLLIDDITEVVHAQRHIAWREVAKRMAHEFKNPLTPIQLATERIRDKLITKLGQREHAMLSRLIEVILQQVQAMKDIVDDFRQYENPTSLQFEKMDVNGRIRDIVDLYRCGVGQAQIVWERDSQDVVQIYADSGRFRQLMHNLISNSKEVLAGRESQKITIKVSLTSDKNIKISVSDNGPGFDIEEMDRLLEPYITTKKGGTGLGLAIAQKIMEEHSGKISLRNIHTKNDRQRVIGAKVSLVFPQHKPLIPSV